MLLGDDVIADRQTQSRPLAGWLGGEKRLEQLVLDLRRNAGAVVTHPHLDHATLLACGHAETRVEGAVAILPRTLGGGVEAVAEKIEEHAGHFLRRQLDGPK